MNRTGAEGAETLNDGVSCVAGDRDESGRMKVDVDPKQITAPIESVS